MNVVFPIDTSIVTAGPHLRGEISATGQRMPVLQGVIRALFDSDFYLVANPDVAAAGLDPLEHFLECGMREGRSPHPLFDARFYAAQMPVQDASEPAFLHYLQDGALNRLDPHPLFVTAHYIAQTESGTLFGQLPLLHFLTSGTRAQHAPNPLFDAAYYRRVNHIDTAHPRHPLLHYVETGWRAGCRTHPLFDLAYYLALRPDVALAGHDPLAHFLRHGHREVPSTHEMFDAAHYRSAYRDRPEELDAIDEVGAILHYATHAGPQPPSPHPLFQPDFYTSQGHALSDGVGRDPFLHFLEHGLPDRHDPHPLFDGAFYARRYPDVASQDHAPILHFIRHGAQEGRDPNGFLDAAGYLSEHPEAATCPYGPLSHYLGSDTGTVAPSVRFDPVYYVDCLDPSENPSGLDPLTHYLTSGRHRGRTPLPKALVRLAWRGQRRLEHRADTTPLLLITPDAAGQPISHCALRAIQHLAADRGLACHVALLRGGVLEPEFAATAPTLLLHKRQDVAELLYSFRNSAPDGIVIVNTATMPEVVALAGRLGLRLLAWLHEMPVSIDSLLGGATTMQALAATAMRIVTVSHHAHAALRDRYGLADDHLVMLGNGVDQTAGQVAGHDDTGNTAAALRHELGIPPDALLVLGGGPIDFRRGTDLFIKVAQQVTTGPGPANAHFVWIGEEADRMFSGLCQHDILQLGLETQVRFLSDPALMQRLLAHADVFLMTARAEAFDGDGLQANCNGLAVIAFAGCISASDLPNDDATLVVAYLDVGPMAQAVTRQALTKQMGTKRDRRDHAVRQALVPAPSWASWYRGLRLILEQDFGLPPQPASTST